MSVQASRDIQQPQHLQLFEHENKSLKVKHAPLASSLTNLESQYKNYKNIATMIYATREETFSRIIKITDK